MNRDYINWLETLPCNRKPQRINTWMGDWAPLPEEIDLPLYEDWQDREIQRNPRGVMSRPLALGYALNKKGVGPSAHPSNKTTH